METKSSHGGARAGAGRPKGALVKKVQIRLTERELAMLKIASYPKSFSQYIRERLGLDSDITNNSNKGK